MTAKIDSLPETITAPRTDPVYNCHAYLTKVPIGAIRPFIEAFTESGEVVADIFAGSGMTGLAAMSMNRRGRLSDISVLGRHIATGYLLNPSESALRKAAEDAMASARAALGDLYMCERNTDGTVVEMVRSVWSFTYQCPNCAYELVYFQHLDQKGSPPKSCPGCDASFVRRYWSRLRDVPVEVVIRGEDNRQICQNVAAHDLENIRRATEDSRLADVPSQTIDAHREMYSRSGLSKAGMTETSKFFSPRNAIALLELWRAIDRVPDADIRQKLRFSFTAILPRASKRYQWSAKRPLNAQNQTYYIAPVYYEWNVFELFNRKVTAALRAADELFPRPSLFESHAISDVTYDITSADHLTHLKNGSVDYVFTDPPFGSNIFYSDMNLFHEAWLGETTEHTSEAVVHTTGKRKNGSEERYEKLLRQAFNEARRVLKPGRYMSVVFGNSSGRIWGLVQRALRDAGFKSAPAHVAILDKGQRSVKGLNSGSEGVVTVDLIVTVQKPMPDERVDDAATLSTGDTASLIQEAIDELSLEEARNPSHVYARVLRKAINRHLTLDNLHLTDVLIALRSAGYTVHSKTGLLTSVKEDQKKVA